MSDSETALEAELAPAECRRGCVALGAAASSLEAPLRRLAAELEGTCSTGSSGVTDDLRGPDGDASNTMADRWRDAVDKGD